MIIRAPTRTKTKSFNGPQMAFKFPSTESLQDVTLDEYHLNNHHLLNDNVGKNSDDVASQILSDSSNTNTQSGHSSNGYYSFANISDNTTSSTRANALNSRRSAVSSDLGKASDVRSSASPLWEPGSEETCEDNRSSPRLNASPMEMIPESNGFSSYSTVFQSIPTAANISYDIASSISLAKSADSQNSSVQKLQPRQLHRTPTMTRVGSTTSTRSSLASNKHRLKRSKAVRCKGGLLQYFQSLRLRFKRQLHKLICGIREKMSKDRTGKDSSYNAGKPFMRKFGKAGLNRKVSEGNNPKTSHLRRTQRYVSNLQRSMSCKSLQPVLMPKTNGISLPISQKANPRDKGKEHNPATSLRRTNSSIRRAASVINTSPGPKPAADAQIRKLDEHAAGTAHNKLNKKPGLVRSAGSHSLNSLARQPSIVVKNKVIPLSMHPYSIDEEKDEEGDEYVISTNSMRPLTPIDSVNSDNEPYVDASEPSAALTGETPDQLSQALNHYFKVVIARRIMMKLQLAEYQESGSKRSYLNAIESIIKDYDSESNVSDLFDGKKSALSTTDNTSGQDDEDEDPETESDYGKIPNLNFAIQSPFSKHNSSIISLSAGHLKRSLTLPINVKV